MKTVVELCTVRQAVRQLAALDELGSSELSRSQLVRMLVEDFIQKPVADRQALVVEQLFGGRAA